MAPTASLSGWRSMPSIPNGCWPRVRPTAASAPRRSWRQSAIWPRLCMGRRSTPAAAAIYRSMKSTKTSPPASLLPCASGLKTTRCAFTTWFTARWSLLLKRSAIPSSSARRTRPKGCPRAGVPVYNYVVTIDDALMEITHVIRGDDHLLQHAQAGGHLPGLRLACAGVCSPVHHSGCRIASGSPSATEPHRFNLPRDGLPA